MDATKHYIGIDPSLNCTAVTIDDSVHCFVDESIAEKKSGGFNKWFERTFKVASVHIHTKPSMALNSSDTELNKLIRYDEVTTKIMDVIYRACGSNPVTVAIEGYSHSSAAGPLIDLVTFSTLLRVKIFRDITTDVHIIPPSTLKVECAKLCYEPTVKGKKTTYKNENGVSGGKFTKKDIELAIYNKPEICTPSWKQMLLEHKDELQKLSAVPKPLEDINDSQILRRLINNS